MNYPCLLDLSTLPEYISQAAYIEPLDINDSGTVAIFSSSGFSGASITIDSNGTITNVGLGKTVVINSINNQEDAVGSIYYGIGPIYGFYSDDEGQATNLEPAARPESNYISRVSTANDIDDNGNIVGSGLVSTSLEDLALEATLWEDPTQPGASLGTLGGENSAALGINNLMQVVGSSFLEDDSTQHAFLWENGDLIDLNSLVDSESGWELTSAFEINDSSDIIGIGTYNGVQRGFVARAVPEPSLVLGILGLGVFGLGGWLKRKGASR